MSEDQRSPRPFMFGVATADHQCEAFVPNWADIRDSFDSRLRMTERGQATDFWTRYKEDVRLAAGLGCHAFRFSVSWARIEPRAGEFDQAVLDHYAEVATTIKEAGMEPIVTLHHYTWPIHIESSRGMTDPSFPQRFAAYAAAVSTTLAGLVDYWVTFNEPTELVFGYFKPWWEGEYRMPPGQDPARSLSEQLQDVGRLIPNLFIANKLARAAIHSTNPGARVSANPLILGLPGPLRRFLDWRVTRLRDGRQLHSGITWTIRQRVADRTEVDLVVALLSATPARGTSVDFSVPYATGCLRLLVAADSQMRVAADMGNGPIAVVHGLSGQTAASAYLTNVRLLSVASYSAGLSAVDEGRAIALLGDDVVLRQFSGSGHRLLDDMIGSERYVVAVAKNRPALLAAVNRVIEAGSGEPTGEAPIGLTREEGWISVGVRGGLPGVSFQDPASGTWSGSEIDLAKRLATYIVGSPNRVRFRPILGIDKVRLLRPWARPIDELLKWLELVFTVLNSNWWHLGMAGELPDWLCPAGCAGEQDFVGFDYYWGVPWYRIWRLGAFSAAAHGQFQSAPVWPGGLRSCLHYLRRKFPHDDILIVENGSVVNADGVSREEYLRKHLQQVLRAMREGTRLIGYVGWAITSNREWGLSFGPSNDFGLHSIDLDNDSALTRRPTASSRLYADFIARFVPPPTRKNRLP